MPSPNTARYTPWLWLLASLILGLSLALLASTVSGLSTGPSQLEHTERSWDVYDGRTIGQVLRIDPERTVGIRLWLDAPDGITTGTLAASLYSFEHKRDIAQTTVPVSALRPDQPTDFRFSRLDLGDWPLEEPLTVELRVATTGVQQSAALVAYGSTNRFPNGPVVVNGKQRAAYDLAFVVLYPGTWLDNLLPITHIAEHRPGIFGWPPLYGLLAWLAIWSSGALLASFIRSS